MSNEQLDTLSKVLECCDEVESHLQDSLVHLHHAQKHLHECLDHTGNDLKHPKQEVHA